MPQTKKRILILTPGFPSDDHDSTCLPFLQNLVRYWSGNSLVEIVVMSLQYPYHRKEYQWKNIRVIPMNGRNKGGIIRHINRIHIRRKMLELYDQFPIDGVISIWYGECAWAGHWLKIKKQVPHYCWLWGQDAKKQNSYPSGLKLPKQEIISLSDSLANTFLREHGQEVHRIIPPGMEILEGETIKDIDILGAGSLIPLKQFEIFIEVVAQLKRQVPALRAIIAGKGPEEKKLRELIAHYHLENELILAGELSNSALRSLMQRSKILVHPSSYEGFSISCLEALYSGMHVCSFQFPMKQSIPNWYTVKDKDQMIETCRALLIASPIKISDPFPLSKTINSLMDLF